MSADDDDLKRCLVEAGLYEENMDRQEMLHCFEVIKSSKNTAQEEDQNRSIIDSANENCKLLEEIKEGNRDSKCSKLSLTKLSKNLVLTFEEGVTDSGNAETKLVSTEENISPSLGINTGKLFGDESLKEPIASSDENIKISSQTKTTVEADINWDVFNCPPIKHKPLDIIIHDPKYRLPVYCDPKVLNFPFKRRVSVIHNFHKQQLDKFYEVHRKSINSVPWGKPISSSPKFNGCLDRQISKFTKNGELEKSDDFLKQDAETSDDDKIYTSRSGRQTKRKVYVEYPLENNKKSKKSENDDFVLSPKQPPKRQCLAKLSKVEITKRSKLFADSSPKLSRSEMLFEKLAESDKKNKQAEKVINYFSSNIEQLSDEDFVPNSQEESPKTIEIKPQELSIRRRITPPRGRKTFRKPLPEKDKSKNSKTTEKVQLHDTILPDGKTTAKHSNDVPEAIQNSSKEKAKCPICSKVFFQDEIEEHASSCGLGMETESNFENLPRSNQKTISCYLCDKVMLKDTDYEVHVKECIPKASSKH